MIRHPLGFLLCLPLVVILLSCCSGEFTQEGTGQAAWIDVNNPPTQQETTQACVSAKSNALQAAKGRCTEKYPNCQLVSYDACTTANDTTAQTVNATVTGHFRCCS